MKIINPSDRHDLIEKLFDKSRSMLVFDEDETDYVYLDTKGKLTGGIGHNFTDKKLSKNVRDLLFAEDLTEAVEGAFRVFPELLSFSEPRILAIINMVFQMGAGVEGGDKGLFGFRNTIRYIRLGEWEKAGENALLSKWATVDSPKRARRVIRMLVENRFIYEDLI